MDNKEIERKKIALLIDQDNFSLKYFNVLKDELNEIGDIIIIRAYGNFTDKAKKDISELGINPFLQLPYTAKKNASDIRIVIDAMDLLAKEYINCFCLATSDSDFTPLVIKLREENIFVLGAGESKTPPSFKRQCDQFINVDEILAASESQTKVGDERIIKLVKDINAIIKTIADGEGYAYFSEVLNILRKNQPDFNPKNYSTIGKSLPFFQKELGKYYDFKKVELADLIKVKGSK
jgi:uncharacterized protein (TIGR00288 family)